MSPRARVLALVATIPRGCVATRDDIAKRLALAPALVATMLAKLSDDERDALPWHRVVAAGGAIGWGPHRDQQFARLAREGVPVSPAGVVQEMERVAVTAAQLGEARRASAEPASEPLRPAARSRGMRERP